MPKATLSSAFISSAVCPEGKKKQDFYDTKTTGFVLEVRSNGGKTYYLRYQDKSSAQRQFKIGRCEDITFAAAQKKAQQLRSEVVMGGDPRAEKAKNKGVPLYRELAYMHLQDAKLHLKSYDTLESCLRNHVIPRWGKTRLDEITSRAVTQWLAEKRASGSSPATVEKMRVVLSRSYVLGAKWEVSGTDKNPCRDVPRKPLLNARQRYLSAEEAARLRKAVLNSQNSQLRYIIDLLLLTGARKRELLDAKWEHFDLDRRSWLVPTSKTGRSRHIPLSSAALEVIGKIPRFDDCCWLLPNPDTRAPFVSIKNSFYTAIKSANLPGLRIHDLRHSAASFFVNAGVDLYAVGKILGHANVASTSRYSHLSSQTLLAAVEAGALKQAI